MGRPRGGDPCRCIYEADTHEADAYRRADATIAHVITITKIVIMARITLADATMRYFCGLLLPRLETLGIRDGRVGSLLIGYARFILFIGSR